MDPRFREDEAAALNCGLCAISADFSQALSRGGSAAEFSSGPHFRIPHTLMRGHDASPLRNNGLVFVSQLSEFGSPSREPRPSRMPEQIHASVERFCLLATIVLSGLPFYSNRSFNPAIPKKHCVPFRAGTICSPQPKVYQHSPLFKRPIRSRTSDHQERDSKMQRRRQQLHAPCISRKVAIGKTIKKVS
jgi:hypothetical protein